MKALIICAGAALALTACKIDSDNAAGGGGSANAAAQITGKPDSGFNCVLDEEGNHVCTINDNGMGRNVVVRDRQGDDRNHQGRAFN